MYDQFVRAYWNIHKGMYSLQDYKTNRVIDRTNDVFLTNPSFVVRQGGRKRVIEEGKKNVHAFAVGYMSEFSVSTSEKLKFEFGMSRVKYNPFTDDYFMYGNDKDSWKYVSKDFVGTIQLESLHHENGVAPRVYI